jgi:hypothetical protein
MPLGFNTLNRGVIAFGFFNVQIDMLLCDRYFTFASDWCEWVIDWATTEPEPLVNKKMYVAEYRDMGNLGLAIQGVDTSGLIGKTHIPWPFPRRQEDFKQQPEGWQNRAQAEEIAREFADFRDVPYRFDKELGTVGVGDYTFDKLGFRELILYVWRGGMPMWRDEVRPQYVLDMMDAVKKSQVWLFQY